MASLKCSSEGGIPLIEAGIRPLVSFGGLTELELLSPCTPERCSIQLNDSIISALSMALPRLTSLSLGSAPCRAATSDVTVASLVALSTNCVDLDFLQLHFNANDITTRCSHENPRTHKFTCKLRTLSVGSQPLPSNYNDILLITFTILHIFPHLEAISSQAGYWEEVEEVVRLFREAPKIFPFLTAN